ncbi:hypothetical protein CROQUDRAFT_140944 [Cronartium quercuum f. sp. fusiforme G11]|uniref:Uncharacterized protein n=1 Tax=Cronartium quercuum f. sp. fusiforme G11 TaxID=708437 RepID=A0A9P6NXS2_9BASI|nr:hypothetical protein CROQUDRAFT_140944 [Cronartium quercuum f. sp. fusiforme G11]
MDHDSAFKSLLQLGKKKCSSLSVLIIIHKTSKTTFSSSFRQSLNLPHFSHFAVLTIPQLASNPPQESTTGPFNSLSLSLADCCVWTRLSSPTGRVVESIIFKPSYHLSSVSSSAPHISRKLTRLLHSQFQEKKKKTLARASSLCDCPFLTSCSAFAR